VTRRACDCAGALAGLILLAPLFAVVALLIRLDSRGPVWFRQRRVGKGFREFDILKFRTMHVSPAPGPLITVDGDSRITRVGRRLRAAKLDELPQLVNVLLGHMSLVGPRPEVPRYVSLFRQDYAAILTVPPGLTDPASLEYADESARLARAADAEDEYVQRILPAKIAISKAYLRRRSPRGDLALLAITLGRLLGLRVPVPGRFVEPPRSARAVRSSGRDARRWLA
jgi:lipopolysaccharide/colanic/teichoic acid biosynthesis glycosyltransferase